MASCYLFLMILLALLALLPNFNGFTSCEGKMLSLHPLTAGDVYRLLHERGRSDAVPQGRIITQGLAAVSGFALGLTKGLGGALLFDLLTANLTASTDSSNSATSNTVTRQEVCFSSRSARSLEEAEAIAEAYSRIESKGKRQNDRVRTSEAERKVKARHRNKRGKYRDSDLAKVTNHDYSEVKPEALEDDKEEDGEGGDTPKIILTTMTNPTTTATNAESPTTDATNTQDAVATATDEDNGAGTGTQSTSTTETNNAGAINCIVLEKPAVG